MKDKQKEEYESEIISLKQLNEQLETELSKKEKFILDNYPTINDFEIKKGWHGGGISTYKVVIDVFSEDLHKLITYFTHTSLRKQKWTMISSEIRNSIKEEIKRDFGIKEKQE